MHLEKKSNTKVNFMCSTRALDVDYVFNYELHCKVII